MTKTMMPILLSTILFFSGCAEKQPCKKIVVNARCPVLKTLRRIDTNIPIYKLKPIEKYADGTVLFKIDDVVEASSTAARVRRVVDRQRRQIDFYVMEISRYNKKYGGKK